MNYEPKFIDGLSIEDCKSEIKWWHDRQYRYGYSIDKTRLWDLAFTIKQLKNAD